MKRIAVDLDGVVFDSENLYRVYTESYDVDILKGDNLIDNTQRLFQKRYNWPEHLFKEFYKNNFMNILSTANIMTGADIILKKLNENFELIIVTARSDIEVEIAKEKLNKLGLKSLKYFNNEHHKIDRFIEEKVDYIIDDDEEICKNASSKNIKTLYFKNAAAPIIEKSNYLKIVNNWGEIYKCLTID